MRVDVVALEDFTRSVESTSSLCLVCDKATTGVGRDFHIDIRVCGLCCILHPLTRTDEDE